MSDGPAPPSAMTQRRVTWLLALVVVAVNVFAIWGPATRGTGAGDLEIDVIYRYGGGDIQYFPFIRGLSDWTLGDPVVLENHTHGVLSFPFPAFVPYGLLLPVFGAAAWMIVDAVFVALTFLALAALLRAFRLRPFASAIVAAAVVLVQPEWLMGYEGLRIPRPFLTTPLYLWALAGTVRLCTDFRSLDAPRLRRLGLWVGAGCALLLQSDLFSAVSLHMLVGVVAAAHFVAAARRIEHRRRSVSFLAGFAPAYAVLAIPFALQRWFEPADLPRRMGVIPVEAADVWAGIDPLGVLLPVVGCALLLVAVRYARDEKRMWAAAAACGLGACAELSYTALALALGKTIQPYHFQAQPSATYAAIGLAAAAVGAILHRLRRSPSADTDADTLPPTRRLWPVLVLVIVVPTALRAHRYRSHAHPMTRTTHLRTDFRTYAELGRDYRAAFAEVLTELRRDPGPEPLVLATLDYQVFCWWTVFTDGFVFNPDPFSTTLADRDIEERLFDLGKLVGLSPAEFRAQITATDKTRLSPFNNDTPLNNFFWFHNKYQFSAHHRFAPLGDYAPESIAPSSAVRSSWHAVLPLPVVEDMLARYESHEPSPASATSGRRPPDVIVMVRRGPLAVWDRQPAGYRLSLQNDVFSVYRRR